MRWLWRLLGRIPCWRREVLLNLTDDKTAVRGVLWQVQGRWFVLRRAELVLAGKAPVPMDGEVVIERAKVFFIQVV